MIRIIIYHHLKKSLNLHCFMEVMEVIGIKHAIVEVRVLNSLQLLYVVPPHHLQIMLSHQIPYTHSQYSYKPTMH